MFNDVLQSIHNVAIWPVVSFVIFFIFFLSLLWWVFTVDKEKIRKMSEMPLETADGIEVKSKI